MLNKLFLGLGAFIILLSLTGCQKVMSVFSSQRPEPSPVERVVNTPPNGFDVRFRIKDWTIVDHRILNYDATWGSLRVAGRFDHLGRLVFKIKSSAYPNNYWLAEIPSVGEGEYEIHAIIFNEPDRDLKPINPPGQISISIHIKDGVVVNHLIHNPHPGWGTFYVHQYKQDIMRLRNNYYPEHEWAVQLPQTDGKTVISAVLTSQSSQSRPTY